MNIPVVHVQGGEVTGSIDEKVRHAVTKLSNLHLVSDGAARERVMRLGEAPSHGRRDRLSVDRHRRRGRGAARRSTSIRSRSTAASGPRPISRSGYLVVMQHPVTTEYDEARAAGRGDAVRGEGHRAAGALVLAERRRRLRRHVEGHPRLPRAGEARQLPPLPQHVPRGLPAPAGALRRRSSATRAWRSASARSSACRR